MTRGRGLAVGLSSLNRDNALGSDPFNSLSTPSHEHVFKAIGRAGVCLCSHASHHSSFRHVTRRWRLVRPWTLVWQVIASWAGSRVNGHFRLDAKEIKKARTRPGLQGRRLRQSFGAACLRMIRLSADRWIRALLRGLCRLVQVKSRIDQRDMRQRLRKITQKAAGFRIELLAQQPNIVA